jgi:Ser/Thr protein kinase RdoA (MazF antagonist)
MNEPDPFAVIAAPPPKFSVEDAVRLVVTHYGLDASARPLVSERDQNFLLRAARGERAILKIANASEAHDVTDFQIRALLHIERVTQGALPVPRIIPTLDGASSFTVESGQGLHVVRLVSFLDGEIASEASQNASTARSLGVLLGRLDEALEDFSHPGQDPALLWDMKQAPALRRLLPHLQTPECSELVTATLDEFERSAQPAFAALPWQVIHNDANPDNLLVDAAHTATTGIIDFGDMLRSPRIVELAVAGAYLRETEGNPLTLTSELVAGYHTVSALARAEIDVLHTLVKTRLATTILILRWRESLRGPGDAYLTAAATTEHAALPFLRRLAEIPAENAAQIYSQVCASASGRAPA